MKNIFYILLFATSILYSECADGQVELWPDYAYGGCFDIATTTSIDFSDYYANINDVIPPEIGQLINLQVLDLSGPNGQGHGLYGAIPLEIGNLLNLTHLDFSGNQF